MSDGLVQLRDSFQLGFVQLGFGAGLSQLGALGSAPRVRLGSLSPASFRVTLVTSVGVCAREPRAEGGFRVTKPERQAVHPVSVTLTLTVVRAMSS